MGLFIQEYRIVLGEPYPLPICDVLLLGPSGGIQVQALIDSGAVRPIFPFKAAEDAGIDLSRAMPYSIQYGGSITSGRIQPVRIALGPEGPFLDSSVVFVEHLHLPYGLLGRIGLFDRFNEVAFIHKVRKQRVEFRR